MITKLDPHDRVFCIPSRTIEKMNTKNGRSTPYFHFPRRPLRKAYQSKYEALQEAYAPFMDAWQSEWTQFLSDKYDVPLRPIYMAKRINRLSYGQQFNK